MSVFSERIPVGKKFVSRGRTITEGDFSLLTSLTWTTGALHSDREYMRENSQFGEMILAGPCVLACAIGLASTSGIAEALHTPPLHTVALLGLDEVRFKNPVKPGDTLTVHSEFTDVRPTRSNPKRAVVQWQEVVFNQRGEVVCEFKRANMVEAQE